MRQAVQKFCPENIAQRVSGKLEVSVTQVRAHLLPFRNIRWKEFESKVLQPCHAVLLQVALQVIVPTQGESSGHWPGSTKSCILFVSLSTHRLNGTTVT